MTTFAQHRAAVESFVDCMHGGADNDALARILAENEVTIFWRPLPSAVEMQGHLAPLVGMQPWELRTKGE